MNINKALKTIISSYSLLFLILFCLTSISLADTSIRGINLDAITPYIINADGEINAKKSQYVQVKYAGGRITGTLISKQHVLIGAHYIYNSEAKHGTYDYRNDLANFSVQAGNETIPVVKIAISPYYNPAASGCKANNFAVLTLAKKTKNNFFKILKNLKQIKLGKTVFFAGFGCPDPNSTDSNCWGTLRKGHANITDIEDFIFADLQPNSSGVATTYQDGAPGATLKIKKFGKNKDVLFGLNACYRYHNIDNPLAYDTNDMIVIITKADQAFLKQATNKKVKFM